MEGAQKRLVSEKPCHRPLQPTSTWWWRSLTPASASPAAVVAGGDSGQARVHPSLSQARCLTQEL